MRKLLIGILLFLLWMSLSTWYYTSHLFPLWHPAEETVPSVDPPTESPPETATLPEIPDAIVLYFDFDKSVILPSANLESFLNSSIDYMEADTNACLVLTGYTCSIGSESYNMELGKRRALAVQTYFLDHGCSTHCTIVSSKGETEAVADNSTMEGRKKNRRVTVHIKPQ